jgi:tetraacyldisaccharide 4'-kinase
MPSLLWPTEALYASIVRIRWWLYANQTLPQSRLRNPVVSVGNLTTGGTGKTPTTITLARLLQRAGERVAVLSRGYRGVRSSKPLLVSDGERLLSTARAAGDEAIVLAQNLPGVVIAVARNRGLAGEFVERQFQVSVHLLDDGFQHLALERNLNLLLIDATNPFGGGLFPRGRLREPLEAIRRADAVILTRAELNASYRELREVVQRFNPEIPCLLAHQRLGRIRQLGCPDCTFETIPNQAKVVAFAGIGNPAQFFEMLRRNKVQLVDSRTFADHCDYTASDCHDLLKWARSLGVEFLVTTEKDAVKLHAEAFHPCTVLTVGVTMDFSQPELLQQLLEGVLKKKSR